MQSEAPMINNLTTALPMRAGLTRPFETAVAIIGLTIAAPFICLAAIAIALSSRAPVIFRQKRVGQNGKLFDLYKLRTMRNTDDGLQVTASDDSRITWVGRLLRKTKLDELPELWNVVRGDMSLVGPRPEVPRYVDLENPLWRLVLRARPGLTDPMTVYLRNEEALLAEVSDRETFYLEILQPFKLRGYQEYLRKRTWRGDLKVLWKTLVAVIVPGNAPSPTVKDIVVAGDDFSAKTQLLGAPKNAVLSEIRRNIWLSNGWLSRMLFKQVQLTLDLLVLGSAFVVAYLLRFDFNIPREQFSEVLTQLPLVVLIQCVVLVLLGVYTFIWRYTGIAEMRAFVKAAFFSFVPVLMLRLGLPVHLQQWRVPLSIIIIDTFLAFGGVMGVRVLRRVLYERRERQQKAIKGDNKWKRPVLLIGAGRAGMLAVKEIQGRGDMDLDIKGFIDDDPGKQGAVLSKIKVLGTTQDLPQLVRQLGINHVVITIAQASRQEFRRLLDICERIPVKVQVIPGLYELLQGKLRVSRIRDLQIEDLLGRDPVRLDEHGMREFLTGKRIMVTGAGGSIGSELARQAVRFNPSSLILVERSECALFDIDGELREGCPDLSLVPLMADVGDEARMRSIFALTRPQVVLHAAAHKHVPMMECNAAEAVKNNVLATHLLGEMSGEFGVEAFVLISTDKAVRPTSIMGASKRVAELVVQDLNRRHATRYVAVRFGNVIGSAGSVIPIFRRQIQKGGPVTVTHPDMMRYFMTIPESAQLVLQAGSMGEGGEIFVLDMGEPVRILDLAIDIITLSGLKPFEEIDITFTGVRPGEKLFEELEITEECMAKTRHPKIFIGKIAAYPEDRVGQAVTQLSILSRNGREQELREYLDALLPEAQLSRGERPLYAGSERSFATRGSA